MAARNVAGLEPSNCAYCSFGRIPLKATATVHMQSDAHERVAVVWVSGGRDPGARSMLDGRMPGGG